MRVSFELGHTMSFGGLANARNPPVADFLRLGSTRTTTALEWARMTDYAGIFDEPKWADSNSFDEVFLMWRAKPDLGLLVVPQVGSSEPRVIFCNLAYGGAIIFEGGLDHPEGSMTLSEARAALDRVEEIWKRGKGQVERG